jgi:enoyl-[acyl-carrier protein] reductase II
MGTRFVAVRECVASQAYKDALVAASELDTAIMERSVGRPARVLRGPQVERTLAVEQRLMERGASREEALQEMLPYIRGEVNKLAAIEGRMDEGFAWAGQVAGLIHDIPSARELVERMVRDAREASGRLARACEP